MAKSNIALIVTGVLTTHCDGQGGAPQIDWYALRSELIDALESSQEPLNERQRPKLRDCPFCKAKGDDAETILFTAETDVVDGFAYGYTVRCIGCGVSITDEYEDEAVRLWNGKDKPEEGD